MAEEHLLPVGEERCRPRPAKYFRRDVTDEGPPSPVGLRFESERLGDGRSLQPDLRLFILIPPAGYPQPVRPGRHLVELIPSEDVTSPFPKETQVRGEKRHTRPRVAMARGPDRDDA